MQLSFRRLMQTGQTIDWWLYLIPILLTGLGIAVIASLTIDTSRFGMVLSQGLYALLGVAAMVVASRIDYRNWRGMATILYIAVIGLLVLVDRFGIVIFGARRWLAIGGYQLQPSEFMKIVLIIVLARFFCDREELRLKDYGVLAFLVSLPLMLIMHQPDLGTAVILGVIAFGMAIAGGVPKKLILALVAIGVMFMPIAWHFAADYQKDRVMTFLDPSKDAHGNGYNILQALIAVGSGGVYGAGLGQGSQSQNQFLPVAHTDFIFAGVAEATGFIGSVLVILLESFLIIRVVKAAQFAKDRFGYLISVGTAVMLLAQASVNVAMNLGMAPVTGIPLPFVSHGGTALLANFIIVAVIQSIVIRRKKIAF